MSDEQIVNLDARLIVCTCGSENFSISLTNGMDGKTHSIWLKCARCKGARVMRRILKLMEAENQE